jgi:tRNA(Ile)-lysidine synthase|tara:strand:+ start:747 stop:1781 length:1035 start_codon:yes stop_codon:yes gene_type:complete
MNQKSLSVKNKAHKKILSYLKDKKILRIFKQFESSLNIKDKFAVAVSGGPDSLALAFLAKCFSIKYKVSVKYFIVDHKLRKESSSEAKIVINILKKIGISCKILTWNGKKPSTNIQSVAREKRYLLLVEECKKNKIKNILLGHHLDDLFENFLIRILRGSGLKGLISLNKNTKYKDNNIKILRPLLDLEKKNLVDLSKRIFNLFIKDPSNKDKNFKRIRIRNLLSSLRKEGLDKKKLLLTINNLKDSDKSIKFYVDRNIEKNSIYSKKQNRFILSANFFDQAHEIIFRSLTKIIQKIGQKYYPVRGKSISELIKNIKSNSSIKVTLGSCFIEKINESVLISREN